MRAAGPPLLLLVIGLCAFSVASSLKICAFNVQSFGESKANNKRVMGVLLKILSRCDLSLIQEVRDSKGEAIQALVKDLNRFDKSNSYLYVESERLGRKSYKEQYVYIYKNNMLKVKERFQHPKLEGGGTNGTDVFSREPFVIRVHSPTTLVKDFVLVGQHTCPKTAMQEIDELYGVVKQIHKKWKTENVIILGDLNAGCSYVTAKGWKAVRLRNDPGFHWLIGDEQDTTVREKTRCAYDRIIVHGREIISGVVPGSAQAFNFKENFHLTEQEALEVSDHFPVEVDLRPTHRYLLRNELWRALLIFSLMHFQRVQFPRSPREIWTLRVYALMRRARKNRTETQRQRTTRLGFRKHLQKVQLCWRAPLQTHCTRMRTLSKSRLMRKMTKRGLTGSVLAVKAQRTMNAQAPAEKKDRAISVLEEMKRRRLKAQRKTTIR
ncbi:deoxyribonuclease I-like 1-like isoform X3 [Poecilia reticulata]|uniref:deoxyribonuclease I-like 1-like isoform X3 n=1 Tax=Poecilia reticulata TaxID=8081 RepID=UPI0007EC1C3E|nr:PREDICTED: deoxyribonuclease gamma-like isoform X3 [Poecilia reticulata]